MQSEDKNMLSSGELIEASNKPAVESSDEHSNQYPTSLNVNALASLTGFNRKTIGERLNASGLPHIEGPRNSKLYVIKDALPFIYQASGKSEDLSKLDAEKLRLQTAKATLAEIELAEKQQELIPINEIISIVSDEYTTVRNIMSQIPSALATKLTVETDSRVIADLIDAEVQSALSNLKLTSEEALKAQITTPTITIPEKTEDNE